MSNNVNSAFVEFINEKVNIEQEKTNRARNSRDNLINNIKSFSGDSDFFQIYSEKILNFGSFGRRTKIRPIDDIDLMICISAEGQRTYVERNGIFYINGSSKDSANGLLKEGTNYLNSNKVINRFISKLGNLKDYRKAEMHKNQEAATLQLLSYTWNFDIVPCFYTDTNFYLIPDGQGNWKKTDPRIDRERTTSINQKHFGKLLELIRVMKYWNNRKVTLKIGSYLLETMILNRYEKLNSIDNWIIDIQIRETFKELATSILYQVDDPKKIQGNLNSFTMKERMKISNSFYSMYQKANEAINKEINENNQKGAINKWREIFGDEFPEYID